MQESAEAKAVARWFARGALGFINMLESAVADGLVPSDDAMADLRTVERRLRDLLTRLDQKGTGAVPVPNESRPAGAAGRRYRGR